MFTVRKIAANRANAQKSTGPRSVEGKAVSRLNAFKHGLYAKQSNLLEKTAGELDKFAAALYREHRPAGCVERTFVDTLIHCEWSLRTYRAAESLLWRAVCRNPFGRDEARALANIQSAIALHEGSQFRALKNLQRQQAARRKASPAQSIESQSDSELNGFGWDNWLRPKESSVPVSQAAKNHAEAEPVHSLFVVPNPNAPESA